MAGRSTPSAHMNKNLSLFTLCAILWSWAEKELRRNLEHEDDDFQVWRRKVVKAVAAYNGINLVGSIARKIKTTLQRHGGPIDD